VVTAQNAIQETANRKNLLLLVSLRWMAVLGQIAAIGVSSFWLHIDLRSPTSNCSSSC
jgi:two-component system sensor histidine kinase RegB